MQEASQEFFHLDLWQKLEGASPPDRAEEIGRWLKILIEERRQSGDDVDSSRWRGELVDAATRQMAQARQVSSRDLGTTGALEGDLDEALSRWPAEIWEDAHALGWIHEQYGAAARQQSFCEHVQEEAKHASSTVSTQLYTPRWVADILARGAMATRGCDDLTVLDPAVGGGQMLLAALAIIAERHPERPATRWAQSLWGFDLDEDVVEVARRTLAFEVARRKGGRDLEAEAIFAEQILCKDGLFGDENKTWTVVLTNPPYMGWRSMPEELRQRLDPQYRPYQADLFSAFIARCHDLAEEAVGILAQQSIWYLRRFEKARRHLLDRGELRLFVHLGAGAFWNLDGEKASVVAFVQSTTPAGEDGPSSTLLWDLRALSSPEAQKEIFYQSLKSRRGVDDEAGDQTDDKSGEERVFRRFDVHSISTIPGRPLCHDLPRELRGLFATNRILQEVADIPGGQNKTGRNRKYIRPWHEVDEGALRRVDALGGRGSREGRWVFYSKGGRFAPWWGNWNWVVDWSEEARRFYSENRTSNLLKEQYWFRQGIVYTDFGGKRFNARWMPPGCLFDMTGPAIFPKPEIWPTLSEHQRLGAMLAILNSSPARRMLRALNPTLHFQVRDVRALPIPEIKTPLAARLADHTWTLIDGLRDLHRGLPGDPLFDPQAKVVPDLMTLISVEEELDRQLCKAYGVRQRPVEGASIAHHSALKHLS